MLTAGRCALFLTSFLLLSSSWEHSKFGANGQGVLTIIDVLLDVNNNEVILERQAASTYSIAVVSGPTSAAGTTVAGTDLWQLDVFLTNGTRQNPDLSSTARIQATAVTFPDTNAPTPGQVLRFNNVTATFDLSSITCGSFGLICVSIQKGPSANPDFQLVPASQPGCVNIVCRGVVINKVEPLILNRNSVLQGVRSNSLELAIQLTADSMYRSVEGNSLVDVEVFGNLQPDGRGSIRYPAVTNPIQSVSYGISNSEVSVLPPITATLDLSSVGCNQLAYICVDVQKASSPTPPYTLEFVPAEASIACREISCAQLTVTSGSFTSGPLGEYKASHFVTFQSITFVSRGSGGSVASSTGALWSLEIAIAGSNRNIYDASRTLATIPPGQDGRAFLAGSTLTFSGVTVTLDLSPYECQEMGFIAITLLKNANSPVDFTLFSQAFFEVADCRGVTITGVTLSPSSLSPNGFPLQEWTENQDMLFDVTFDTDARYGSVQGSQLWVLQVAVSNAPSPNFASLMSTLATLNGAEMNMGVEGGNPLTFQDTSVRLSFLDSCGTTKYFCVAINKGTNPSVDNGNDFILSGQGVGCMVVDCIGISITGISLMASPPVISEHQSQSFSISASIAADPDAGSARGETLGSILWSMRVVLNRDENIDVTSSSGYPVSADVTGAPERTSKAWLFFLSLCFN